MVELPEDSLNRCFATFSDWNLQLSDCPIDEIYREDDDGDVCHGKPPPPEVS